MHTPPSSDGILLIDKPSGPTSHDVVARMRAIFRQRSIGHTGTLDPLASGLVALVLGRATRLAPMLTGSDKTYEATIRLGFATTTDDALGQPLPGTTSPGAAHGSTKLSDDAIREAIDAFRGTFDQMPPAHSAKKVGGVKAYDAARRDAPLQLSPVQVTVRSLEWLGRSGDTLTLRLTATAGFYVRALARDIGIRLGAGAHLAALRRLRSGPFRVDDALTLEAAERLDAAVLHARLLSPVAALPDLPSVVLSSEGLKRAGHGNWVSPGQYDGPWAGDAALVKLVAPGDGRLVALARPRAGALHPVVVLG